MSFLKSPVGQSRLLEIRNDSSELIPAFAVLRETDAVILPSGRTVVTVGKPDTTVVELNYLVNSHLSIAADTFGIATRDFPAYVLFEQADGTPVIGETWGPRSGSWKLHKNLGGFEILGAAMGDHVLVIREPMSHIEGYLLNDLEPQGTALLAVYRGQGISWSPSTEIYTVRDRAGYSLGAGDYCLAVRINDEWRPIVDEATAASSGSESTGPESDASGRLICPPGYTEVCVIDENDCRVCFCVKDDQMTGPDCIGGDGDGSIDASGSSNAGQGSGSAAENVTACEDHIPTSVVNITLPGCGNPWTDPANAKADDDVYATNEIPSGGCSDYLKATGYGFAIPADAHIDGIIVKVGVKAGTGSGTIKNARAQLTADGMVVTGLTRENPATWTASEQELVFGSQNDRWGISWTPAMINSGLFGVFFWTYNVGGGLRLGMVDYICIEIAYSTGDASGGLSACCPGVSIPSTITLTKTDHNKCSTAPTSISATWDGSKWVGTSGTWTYSFWCSGTTWKFEAVCEGDSAHEADQVSETCSPLSVRSDHINMGASCCGNTFSWIELTAT